MYVSATEIPFIFVWSINSKLWHVFLYSEGLKYFDSSSITELNNNNKLDSVEWFVREKYLTSLPDMCSQPDTFNVIIYFVCVV